MKKIISDIAIFFLVLVLIVICANIFKKNPTWTLIWKDEFNGTQVDITKWRLKTGTKYGEMQYYLPENITVTGGNLIIKSDKISINGSNYTSGLIDTNEKFNITYGKVEVRGKLPYGKGIWPAYWLVPEVLWPPEIDIMENLGDNMYKFFTDVHWNGSSDIKKSIDKHQSKEINSSVDLSKDFHIYGVEWEPFEIRYYFDNQLVCTFNSTDDNIPTVPHMLVINTAIGGTWGGTPDETTIFPQYHYVDYIRVWQKNKN